MKAVSVIPAGAEPWLSDSDFGVLGPWQGTISAVSQAALWFQGWHLKEVRRYCPPESAGFVLLGNSCVSFTVSELSIFGGKWN